MTQTITAMLIFTNHRISKKSGHREPECIYIMDKIVNDSGIKCIRKEIFV